MFRKFTCATVETSTLQVSPENFRGVYLGNTKTPEVQVFKEPVIKINEGQQQRKDAALFLNALAKIYLLSCCALDL